MENNHSDTLGAGWGILPAGLQLRLDSPREIQRIEDCGRAGSDLWLLSARLSSLQLLWETTIIN